MKYLIPILLIFLILPGVSADSLEQATGAFGIPVDSDSIKNIPKDSDDLREVSKSFIERKFEEQIANPTLNKILSIPEPIYRIFPGTEPSISFLFLLSIVVWITLLIVLFNSFYPFGNWKYVSIPIVLILSFSEALEAFSEFVIDKISLLDSAVSQLISIIAIILVIALLTFISKNIRKVSRKATKNVYISKKIIRPMPRGALK